MKIIEGKRTKGRLGQTASKGLKGEWGGGRGGSGEAVGREAACVSRCWRGRRRKSRGTEELGTGWPTGRQYFRASVSIAQREEYRLRSQVLINRLALNKSDDRSSALAFPPAARKLIELRGDFDSTRFLRPRHRHFHSTAAPSFGNGRG